MGRAGWVDVIKRRRFQSGPAETVGNERGWEWELEIDRVWVGGSIVSIESGSKVRRRVHRLADPPR